MHLGCWPSLSRASGTPEHWLPEAWPSAQPCRSAPSAQCPAEEKRRLKTWGSCGAGEGMGVKKGKKEVQWAGHNAHLGMGARRCPHLVSDHRGRPPWPSRASVPGIWTESWASLSPLSEEAESSLWKGSLSRSRKIRFLGPPPQDLHVHLYSVSSLYFSH